MAHGAKGNGHGKPGPKPDLDKMVLALHLHLQGESWVGVSKAIGVAYRTLMRWQTRDDWRQVCDKFAPGHIGQLERASFAVLARRLAIELRTKRPDISIAERVLKVVRPQAGDDGEYAGAGFGPGSIVLLPMESKGLESKPMHQVLVQPPAIPAPPPGAPPMKKPVKKGKPSRRVRPRAAGPDE